jgi:hypothetical protein
MYAINKRGKIVNPKLEKTFYFLFFGLYTQIRNINYKQRGERRESNNMKIYLASTAPNNEANHKEGMLPIFNRLISHYHIITKMFQTDIVFKAIKKYKNKER